MAAPPTRFYNPYNFVRPLPPPSGEGAEPETRLLGRCPPPPLHRYVGLTGRIVCELTTVTPTFVSDSYGVEAHTTAGGKVHRVYRFFRDPDGVPAIPGSSLRGVVRSVFEAVTSSCWGHVADRHLSRRLATGVAAGLAPGRLRRDEDGGWWLDPFFGTTGFLPDGPVHHGEPLYAAWVARYVHGGRPIQPRPSQWDGKDVQPYAARGFPRLPPGLAHGTPCWARIRLTQHDWRNRFDFWNVEALGDSRSAVEPHAAPDDRVVQGVYCETGFNIGHKHDERVFFNAGPEAPPPIPVDRDQVRRFLALLEDYRENHRRRDERRPGHTGTGPRPSRFVVGGPASEEGCDGELVYARLEAGTGGLRVKDLAPVSVPRIFYGKSIRDRFPEGVEPCAELDPGSGPLRLCPACRVFGWVPTGEEGKRSSRTYRSRVRFGGARFTGPDPLDLTRRSLDILSAPKPTTVRFYLAPVGAAKTSDLRPERDQTRIDYESGRVAVRGRKFYRPRREVALHPPEENSDQNRTVVDWLKAGETAGFEVAFECLAPVELGALLWALELQPGWVHRVGYGKPLGLGSVEVKVKDLVIHGPDRYAGKGADAGRPPDEPRRGVEHLVERFRTAMARRHGGSFADLVNVKDLRALLRKEPAGSRLPVEYPSLNDDARPESFHWFVVNNGRSYDRAPAGKGVWLGFAADDPGLPYDPAEP